MKRNKTIIEETKRIQWNSHFREAIKDGKLSGRTQYWVETIDNMLELALSKLRKEFIKGDKDE